VLDHGAVSRTGFWTRTVSYVPFARVQSVSVRQGWQIGLMPSGKENEPIKTGRGGSEFLRLVL